MDAKKLGQMPAFSFDWGGQGEPWPGMTLRQWYAGLALGPHSGDFGPDEAAMWAVRYADALLAELAKENA